MIAGAIVLLGAKTRTLQDTGLTIASVLNIGILGIYLIGFFTTLCDWRSISLGILCALCFAVWEVLSQYGLVPQKFRFSFDVYYTSIIGNLLMIVVSLSAGFVIKHRKILDPSLSVWKNAKA
jgi:SSS family solute:Na+ symporter